MPADLLSANLVAALLKVASPNLASTSDPAGMITSDGQGETLRNHLLTDQVLLAAKKGGLSLLSSAGQPMPGSGENGLPLALD
jgi:hypothetical protein